MGFDWVILGGGSRSLKIRTDPAALTLVGGEVVAGLANPIPPPTEQGT